MTNRTADSSYIVGSRSSPCAVAAAKSLRAWGCTAEPLDVRGDLDSSRWSTHDAWLLAELEAPYIVWIGPTSSSRPQEMLSLIRFYLLYRLGRLSPDTRVCLIGSCDSYLRSSERTPPTWTLTPVLEADGIPVQSLRQVGEAGFDGVVSRYLAATRSTVHSLKNGTTLPPRPPAEVVHDTKRLVERMADDAEKMQDEDMSETVLEVEMLQRLRGCCKRTSNGLDESKTDWSDWTADRQVEWKSVNYMCDLVLDAFSGVVK